MGPDPSTPRTYPHGAPCWVDLEVDDVQAAADFYAGLFGWSFTDVLPPQAPGHYLIATLGGQDAAAIGSLDLAGPGSTPAWATYIAVTDADTAAAAVSAAGGRVTAEPEDAGPGGRAASCIDASGAPFRLWQARRRLGAQRVNEPGTWNFSDLLAPDPEAALDLYRRVFAWRAAQLWEGGDLAVTLPGYGDHLAATVYPDIHEAQSFAPQDFADVIAWAVDLPQGQQPRWRVTFAVEDRDAAAQRARELGAQVLSSTETAMTRTVDLRDPLGAELTLSQFTPPTQ